MVLRRGASPSIMPPVTVPGLRPRTTADLERARDQVDWVDDDDLRDLETKSTLGATLLGMFTWGGGHLYLGDVRVGLASVAGLIGWVVITASIAFDPLTAGFWIGGLLNAIWSYRRTRAVNRFVGIRNELALRQGPDPSTYRLLTAAAAANPALAHALPALPAPAAPPPPGPHSALIDQLRKVAVLGRAGVLHAAEVRERKVDLLTAAVPASRAELDELLFALLPLADEGVLVQDDFEYIKQLGADR